VEDEGGHRDDRELAGGRRRATRNAGVAALVQSTPGALGYVSDFYAIQNHIAKARLKNAAGSYVLPKIASIEAAAQLVKGTKIPANNKISLTNPPKSKKYKNAWPMSTFTYILIPQQTPKAAQLKAFVKFALGANAQKRDQEARLRSDAERCDQGRQQDARLGPLVGEIASNREHARRDP